MTKLQGKKFRSFLFTHKVILIVMILLFAERLVAMYRLNVAYTLYSDDLSYVRSGLVFASTGKITMHEAYPSAQIMPGMTVLIGVISMIFGEGTMLWVVLKLLWISMGTMTAWFIYRSVCIFAPRWCGAAAALPLFIPNFVWQDNLILTETPFLLFFTAAVYFTFKMGRDGQWRDFWGFLTAYMGALIFRANIAPYPIFALLYLLVVKYDRKRLLRQYSLLACALLCFVIPWSIRNFIRFGEFIPLTYGLGNPMLLGTYQGVGYPEDDELDYVTNVDDVLREEYAAYFEADGSVREGLERYINLKRDEIQAKYRLKVWWQTDSKSMLYSYLVLKPKIMLTSSFYWQEIFHFPLAWIVCLQYQIYLLSAAGIIAALVLRKNRWQMLWIAIIFFGNLYLYAMAFAFDRYLVSLLPLVYIAGGIGLGMINQLLPREQA